VRELVFLAVGIALITALVAAQEGLEERVTNLENNVKTLQAGPGAQAGDTDFRVYWKDGIRFETADKMFRFRIGGRMQADYIMRVREGDTAGPPTQGLPNPSQNWALSSGPGAEPRQSVLIRRARINLEGTMYENLGFKFQYDFADGLPGAADFKDVYMQLINLPGVGRIRVGQFKESFSLEHMTSSNYGTFMERSVMNAIVPGRSTGIAARNHIEDMATWTLGFFKASNNFGNKAKLNTGGSDWCVTGRFTCAPVYEDKGETLVHLGISGSWRNTENAAIGIAAMPDLATVNPFVTTMPFNNKVAGLLGLETAVVVGPFSAQAEYTAAKARPNNFGTFNIPGWYVEASWFVTGEHRPYDPKNGYFKRVRVKKRLGDDGGFGAIQIAARIDQLRLNKKNISGYFDSPTTNDLGDIINYTLGANWHLNDHSRIMANWVISRPQGSEVWHFLGMRFQVDF